VKVPDDMIFSDAEVPSPFAAVVILGKAGVKLVPEHPVDLHAKAIVIATPLALILTALLSLL
jgi:hypothetical protein